MSFSDEIHKIKYRLVGETFRECCSRVAQSTAEDTEHFYRIRDLLLEKKFLPAGRVQSSMGSPQSTTALNCFVSGTIEDSMDGIMDKAKEAAQTMRLGGGIGFDFSTIRPKESIITTLGSKSSGAVSFMHIFDAVCGTVKSAGDRRGAMMGVLRVDHPDIEEFVDSKLNDNSLTNFNISVAVTDKFMEAVEKDEMFELVFDGRVHKRVSASKLFEKIMRATYDWSEPGILFIDTINKMNNLSYCEDIAATNPCAEQTLPPYGACLLGSYNLTKIDVKDIEESIGDVVRMMDNVIDRTTYPLDEQRKEAEDKRRIGLGFTGLANAIEVSGHLYGSDEFLLEAEMLFKALVHGAYRASIELAKEKGAFPLFNCEEYMKSPFIQSLPKDIQEGIREHGIRNSHLISFAPTGTISITAGNVSSGIEPVFSHSYDRTVMVDGLSTVETITDFAVREWGVKGRTADECTVKNHLDVLGLATKYSDSSVSKTINVGSDVSWDEFKDIYVDAWGRGCKGVTTFRSAGKRYGVLNAKPKESEGGACYFNPETGEKSCS